MKRGGGASPLLWHPSYFVVSLSNFGISLLLWDRKRCTCISHCCYCGVNVASQPINRIVDKRYQQFHYTDKLQIRSVNVFLLHVYLWRYLPPNGCVFMMLSQKIEMIICDCVCITTSEMVQTLQNKSKCTHRLWLWHALNKNIVSQILCSFPLKVYAARLRKYTHRLKFSCLCKNNLNNNNNYYLFN